MRKLFLALALMLVLAGIAGGTELYSIEYSAVAPLQANAKGTVDYVYQDVATLTYTVGLHDENNNTLTIENLSNSSVDLIGYVNNTVPDNNITSAILYLNTQPFDEAIAGFATPQENTALAKCDAFYTDTNVCAQWTKLDTALSRNSTHTTAIITEPGVYALSSVPAPTKAAKTSEHTQTTEQHTPAQHPEQLQPERPVPLKLQAGTLYQVEDTEAGKLTQEFGTNVSTVLTDVRTGKRSLYAHNGTDSVALYGVNDTNSIRTLRFGKDNKLSTDTVVVEGTSVDNATVQLAKQGPVDAIMRCDVFNNTVCVSGWVQTDIPFTDYGAYIEFTVPHFTGYGGVATSSQLWASGSTNYSSATATPNLAATADGVVNQVDWVDVGAGANLNKFLNASGTISGMNISTSDTVSFSSYWSTMGTNINVANVTFKFYVNGTLVCQNGSDATSGNAIGAVPALVTGSCNPTSSLTVANGSTTNYVIDAYTNASAPVKLVDYTNETDYADNWNGSSFFGNTTYTVNSSANLLLIEFLGKGTSVNSVLLNSSNMTEILSAADSNTGAISFWYYPSPPAGAVNITWYGQAYHNQVVISTYSGVNLTNPIENWSSTSAEDANNRSITVSATSSNDMIIDGVESDSTEFTGVSPAQNIMVLNATDGETPHYTGASYANGTGNVTMTYTTNAFGFWAMGAVVLAYNASASSGNARELVLQWDNSTAATWVNVSATTSVDVNVSLNATRVTANQALNASGYFYWQNLTPITGYNVTVNWYNTTSSLQQSTNVTTDSNGFYNATFTLSASPDVGTWSVNTTAVYNTSINATSSATFNVNGTVCVNETGVCLATVQQAVSNATTGQTVVITDNGTYTENITVNKNLTITSNSTQGMPTVLGNNITAFVIGGYTVALSKMNISTTGNSNGLSTINISTNSNVTLSNLVLTLNASSSNAYFIDGAGSPTNDVLATNGINVSFINATHFTSAPTFSSLIINNSIFSGTSKDANNGILQPSMSASGFFGIYNSVINMTVGGGIGYYMNESRNTTIITPQYPLTLSGNTKVYDSYIKSTASTSSIIVTGASNLIQNSTVNWAGGGVSCLAIWFGSGSGQTTVVDGNFTCAAGSTPYRYCAANTVYNVTFVNTSAFDPTYPSVQSCSNMTTNLLYNNYLDINVTAPNGTPISGATVTVLDNQNITVATGTTDSNGKLARLNLTYANYSHNGSASTVTYWENHTITASLPGYLSNSTTRNMTTNQNVTLTLSPFTSCGVLTNNTTMNTNISINGSTCFTINTSNVVLDCAGYNITGNRSVNTFGVLVQNVTNVTVKNCRIGSFDYAINATLTNNSLFQNINVSSSMKAFAMSNATNNTIANSNLSATTFTWNEQALLLTNNALNNTIANTTIASAGTYGITINAGSRYNTFTNISLPSSNYLGIGDANNSFDNISTRGNMPIYYYSASNFKAANVCPANFTNIYAGLVYFSGCNNMIINNITINATSIQTQGIYLINMNGSTISNITVTSPTSGTNVLTLSSFNGNTIKTVNLSNGAFSLGGSAVNNNNISDVIADNMGFSNTPKNNTLTNITLTSSSTALQFGWSPSVNNTFINSTFNQAANPISIVAGGDYTSMYFINVSFNKSKFSSYNQQGNTYIEWYLKVNVTNSTGDGINGTSVNVAKNTGSSVASLTTDSSGLTSAIPIVEYTWNNTALAYNTNLTITASKTGYFSTNVSLNLTASQTANITLPAGGVLNVNPVTPSNNTNAYQNEIFPFTANISCSGSSCGGVTAQLNPLTWWNNSWKYRITISLNTSQITSNLTNFPILVKLNSTRFNYSNAQSGGQDIRFVDNDQLTVLPYEIEVWNTTGDSYIWVNVPQLDGNTIDSIFMYYNNSGASDGQNKTGVWNSNYAGVWHMNTNATDSTSKGDNGTLSGGVTNVSGRIGGAYNFNGINGLDSVADPNGTLNIGTNLGVFVWFKPNVQMGGDILQKGGSGGYVLWPYTGVSKLYWGKQAGSTWASPSLPTVGAWNHIVGTYDGATLRVYYNGSNVANGSAILTFSNAGALEIGDGVSGGGDGPVNGTIDELRIMSVTPSADWVKADYLSQSDSLATFSSESSGGNFITNGSNPMTSADNSCLTNLETGNSCLVTWYVNATGSIGAMNTFSVSVLSTNVSGLSAISNDVNITIIQRSFTIAVQTLAAQSPIENGIKNVTINFTASNSGGASLVNDSTAMAIVNFSGVTRTSSACIATTLNSTSKQYLCNVSMQYYDQPGSWSINASVNDTSSQHAENATTSFTYNSLKAMQLSSSSFSFGSITPGQSASGSSNPLQIHNTGNVNLTQVNLTAYDLANGANNIASGNFTVNSTDALGQTLANATAVTITGAYVGPDNSTSQQNMSLYLWARAPAVAALTYASTQNWVVDVN